MLDGLFCWVVMDWLILLCFFCVGGLFTLLLPSFLKVTTRLPHLLLRLLALAVYMLLPWALLVLQAKLGLLLLWWQTSIVVMLCCYPAAPSLARPLLGEDLVTQTFAKDRVYARSVWNFV